MMFVIFDVVVISALLAAIDSYKFGLWASVAVIALLFLAGLFMLIRLATGYVPKVVKMPTKQYQRQQIYLHCSGLGILALTCAVHPLLTIGYAIHLGAKFSIRKLSILGE